MITKRAGSRICSYDLNRMHPEPVSDDAVMDFAVIEALGGAMVTGLFGSVLRLIEERIREQQLGALRQWPVVRSD